MEGRFEGHIWRRRSHHDVQLPRNCFCRRRARFRSHHALPRGHGEILDLGPLYRVQAVEISVSKLPRILHAELAGKAVGIGSATQYFNSAPRRLLLYPVEECRPTRLLTRRSYQEPVWRDQIR